MGNAYVKDLIVRIQIGLPIHHRDVDWLMPLLEEIEQHGTIDEIREAAEQTGYDAGYKDAAEDAAIQAEQLADKYEDDDLHGDLIMSLRDFEVER